MRSFRSRLYCRGSKAQPKAGAGIEKSGEHPTGQRVDLELRRVEPFARAVLNLLLPHLLLSVQLYFFHNIRVFPARPFYQISFTSITLNS